MFNLTKDGFEAQKKDGVYVFTSPNCFTCKDHVENFQKYLSDFYVLPTSEDIDFFESIGIKLTPTTRVYKNNNLVHSVEGMIFDKQFEELRKHL